MARTKAVLGVGARLSDYLSSSLLARVFPADAVHQALDAYGRNTQRQRRFPAVAGVYYCMALSLYPEAAYEEVFAVVAQGLAWAARQPEPERVNKASISEARAKLGCEPLRHLMSHACVPLAQVQEHPWAFYAGLRVVAMDGSNFEVPDEQENVLAFGYPGSRTGQAGYPQAQCAVLIECATHAILSANIGPYRASEWQVAMPLLDKLAPGMLCLADRGFRGYEHWRVACAKGAQLLWRAASNAQLPVRRLLPDGSYISALLPPTKKRQEAAANAIEVRVIEYTMPAAPEGSPPYRLITSMLDSAKAPALELAALYHERWQIESVFDELKTHLRGGRRVLRSKTAELVRQEFYGWVLAHYAVRWLMHQGASSANMNHGALSFTGHLQLLRRQQPRSGDFPPTASTATPRLA